MYQGKKQQTGKGLFAVLDTLGEVRRRATGLDGWVRY